MDLLLVTVGLHCPKSQVFGQYLSDVQQAYISISQIKKHLSRL